MAASPARICVGVVVGVKGVKGEVRIKSFTENPVDVGAYGPVESEDGTRTWELKAVGEAKGAVVARLKGIADRDQAEALKGEKLYVARAKLPQPAEGTYYHSDLVGMNVVLTSGESKGAVVAVHNFGAGDIIEVGDGVTATVMVPFSSAAIAEVNIKDGVIRVKPLPGVFDDGKDEDEGDDETPDDATPVTRRG